MKLNSIGREKAIELAKTGWWKDLPAKEVFLFQLHTKELCMDFGDFQAAAEQALGRPVWTHEFIYPGELLAELTGEQFPPSFEDICNLLPAEKRIVLTT